MKCVWILVLFVGFYVSTTGFAHNIESQLQELIHLVYQQNEMIQAMQTDINMLKENEKNADQMVSEFYARKTQGESLQQLGNNHVTSPGLFSLTGFSCAEEYMNISCPDERRILVTNAYYGHYSKVCTELCCVPHPVNDCTETVEQNAPQDWLALKALCDNTTDCAFLVPAGALSTCPEPNDTNYMAVYYSCMPEPTIEPIGFTAFMSESAYYESGDIVMFDSIETNLGGFYNTDTSVFVCPNRGMYVFTLSAGCASQVNADIMLNDESLVTVRCHNDHHSQGNVIAVTECLTNQKVWAQVTYTGTLLGNNTERYTSFSGFQSFIY